jgi:seryl-tRNA synthetase
MHNIEYITNNFDEFLKLIISRKIDQDFLERLKKLPDLNKKRKSIEDEKQHLQAENNKINSEIPKLKKNGENEKVATNIEIVKKNNSKVKELIEDLAFCELEIKFILDNCLNAPLCDKNHKLLIPSGGEENFKVVKEFGEPIVFDFKPLTHEEIGEKNDYLDFKQTAKISGSRFVTLKGKVAMLEQGLIRFMVDRHVKENGYELVSPPYLVKNTAMYGVGQLPKFSEESFIATSGAEYGQPQTLDFNDGYRLIPTAEVPLTNLVADKIVSKDELPIRYVAVTPCFRSEIGSAGRDVTGMIRLHQFMKIELVSIVDDSEEQKITYNIVDRYNPNNKLDNELHRMRNCATKILEDLKLPYRVICLPTEDTGFSARITYDIEVWMASQNRYREISSCSYFGDFQARRMNARYKCDVDGKNKFVHTLNGSALAIGRTIAAIMENYQTADGDFNIPEVLKKFM